MSHAKLMFAAELAEMLSSDMQKEGLCGRTLTLKLKTASFEVLLMSTLFSLTYVPNAGQENSLAWFFSSIDKALLEKTSHLLKSNALNLKDIMIS